MTQESSHIVAVGASAGGLEALREMFASAPSSTPMSFVVVQHLSPDYRSMMVELLDRHTALEVREARDGAMPKRGCIDLIRPQTLLRLQGGRLAVENLDTRGKLRPIDTFMESVAEDRGDACVGVILSGTGSDGAAGIQAIHAAGGITAVQDPSTAAFDGMPRSAMRVRDVDIVAPPARILPDLVDLISTGSTSLFDQSGERSVLTQIFSLLKRHTRIDFGLYKRATVIRRLEHRMRHLRLEDPEDYLAHISAQPDEVRDLCSDLLINVTRFFRDAGAIEAVNRIAIPQLVDLAGTDPLRIWVAGCATGEEAYSVAMLLSEALEKRGSDREFRIFATDVNGDVLETASRGEFPSTISEYLSPQLLRKYFDLRGSTYVARKVLRERLLFSRHDVTQDPPFSRLDMITCRNLLIYLKVGVQERVLRTFSSALNDGGILWLGSSESVGSVADHFEPLHSRWKILRAVRNRQHALDLGLVRHIATPIVPTRRERAVDRVVRGLQGAMEGLLPPLLLVDDQLRLLHRSGDVGRLLRVPAGFASLDVRDMLPRPLSALLTTARTRPRETRADVIYRSLRTPGAEMEYLFDLRVRHIPGHTSDHDMFAIFFEGIVESDVAPASTVEPAQISSDVQAQLDATELELRHTRENLQATIEELESANEELQSTNEELVAANEELQSTNEELQSVNEELHTVNIEHQEKLSELATLTDDLNGILTSIDSGILVVSQDLRLRRFNEAARRVFNVIPNDAGRPIEHVTHRLDVPDLPAICEQVSRLAQPEVRHSQIEGGRHALLSVTPRLSSGDVDGVVVVATDVTGLLVADREAEQASAAIDFAAVPLCIVSRAGAITKANAAFAEATGRDLEWIIGTDFRDVSDDTERATLTEGLQQALEGHRWSTTVRSHRPDKTPFWEAIDLVPLSAERGEVPGVIRLSTVLPTLADASDATGLDGTTTYFLWNLETGRVTGTPGLSAVFGLPEFDDGSIDDLAARVDREDLDALKERTEAAKESGRAFSSTCHLEVEGVRHEVLIRAQPIPYPPNGQPVLVSRCTRREPVHEVGE
ncbi:MAG: chemotaxis protein CheB [Sandaracinaceae bacterium]